LIEGKVRSKKYRFRYPEKIKAYNKVYRETHKEYFKRYYIVNRKKILADDKIYYKNNRTWIYKHNRDRLKKKKEWFVDIKKTLYCSKCGEDDFRCLDFHHKDAGSKEMSLANMIAWGSSKKRISDEVAKCSVLCANCHRKLHIP